MPALARVCAALLTARTHVSGAPLTRASAPPRSPLAQAATPSQLRSRMQAVTVAPPQSQVPRGLRPRTRRCPAPLAPSRDGLLLHACTAFFLLKKQACTAYWALVRWWIVLLLGWATVGHWEGGKGAQAVLDWTDVGVLSV
jgi:hypothetical protein